MLLFPSYSTTVPTNNGTLSSDPLALIETDISVPVKSLVTGTPSISSNVPDKSIENLLLSHPINSRSFPDIMLSSSSILS